MKQEHMERILKIGVQLSAERDLNRLLDQLLTCAMELSHCDAGTLYLLDGDVLRFKIMRNREGDTVGVLQLSNAMDGEGAVRPFA